ncbi:MAG: hypothetical protein ABI946_05785 [Chthoniobacterales bacterium]
MIRRLMIGLLLVLALCLTPLGASTPGCALGKPAAQGMSCADCCATMKSCILPKQNPTNAITASSPSQADLTALPFPPVFLYDLAATPLSHAAVVAPRTTAPHSRLAVLCTFLI